MSKETSQNQHCHQLLPMIYGLNNSFGKIILVGLENSASGKKDYQPVVRIGSSNYQCSSLSLESWEGLKGVFEKIDEYFSTYDDGDMTDQCLKIPGFTIRFTISYSDRAIELVENEPSSSGKKEERNEKGRSKRAAEGDEENNNYPAKKRMRTGTYLRSFVFKRNTFDRLVQLSRCIDYRIKYLQTFKNSLNFIIPEIVNYLCAKLSMKENAQYTYYCGNDITRIISEDNVRDEMNECVNGVLKKNNINLPEEDVCIIVCELVTLHLYTLVNCMNATL